MSKYKELEDRTLKFSKDVIKLCNKLPKNTINYEIIKQIVRSACSIGANYREANEALGKKDFAHRLRISRKEAKETTYWLEILLESNLDHKEEIENLLNEVQQLRNILSAIIAKTS
ncbi:MAG TPA: four helix bundle protein [Candidatus Moranbacteria bacterium]|nr:four helix bundle protein [Candidatus Moranbacteria bacterium]